MARSRQSIRTMDADGGERLAAVERALDGAKPHTAKSLADLALAHYAELSKRDDDLGNALSETDFDAWFACCMLDFLHVAAELSHEEHQLVDAAARRLLKDWQPTPGSGSPTSSEEPKPEPRRSRESGLRANYTPPAIS